jgi:hypothetical protein
MVGYDQSSGAAAVVQGQAGKGVEFNVNSDTFGSGTAMVINSSGDVGIGTLTPGTKLHVAGSIQVGDGGETCSGGNFVGAIRYNGGLQFCNGTSWQTLGTGGGNMSGSNNLSELTNTATARTNLGLSALATAAPALYSTVAYTDAQIASVSTTAGNALVKASNLSDLTNVATARTNLGLGVLATASNTDYVRYNISSATLAGVTISSGVASAGSALIGGVTIASGKVQNLSAPTASTDAANKSYVDTAIGSLSTSTGGDFLKSGSVTMQGSFKAINGTAALPGITFAADTDNGMWMPGVNTIAMSTNGVERFRVDSSGNFGIGTTSPGYLVDVAGVVNATGGFRFGSNAYVSAWGGDTNLPSISFDANDGINYNRTTNDYSFIIGSSTKMFLNSSGNLGIGTTNPTASLHVVGTGTSALDRYAATSIINLRRANGVVGAATVVGNGDELARVNASGYDGSGFSTGGAGIRMTAEENFSATNQGTSMRFYTT